MTYVGTVIRASGTYGAETVQTPAATAAGDWIIVVIDVRGIRSPLPDTAVTFDDLIAPSSDWVRLGALSMTPSGDPTIMLDVIAVYAKKATGPGGVTDRYTWSYTPAMFGRISANAEAGGVVLRGIAGVSAIDAGVSYDKAINLLAFPASSGRAGTGHALRVATVRVDRVTGGYTAEPVLGVGAVADVTNRVVSLDPRMRLTMPSDNWQGLIIADEALTAEVPAALTISANITPPQARSDILAVAGWTILAADVAAPMPPTLLAPAEGAWVDLAAGWRLELRHNVLGTVGPLTGIAVWRSTDAGATKKWWKASTGTWETSEQVNATTDPWLDFPSGKWSNAGTVYLLGIATTGSGSATLSEYTTTQLIGSDPPTAAVTVTGLVGGTINDLTPTVVVTGTPAPGATLDAWQVRVFDLAITGTNLATNASFEAGIGGWAGAAGYVAGVCEASDQHASHGDTSMFVTWPGGGICGVARNFPVIAGKTYTWSAYVWISADSPGVRASWLGHSAGEPMQFKQQLRRIQHTFTADVTGSIPLGFETATGRPGSVYVDRIALVEGTDPGEWVYSEPEAGTPTIDSGIILGPPGSWTVPYEASLTSHQQYQVHAKVRQAGGQWSAWATVNVEPDVDTPDAPAISISQTTHEVSGLPGLAIAVVMPAWTGMPMTARVQRLLDGAWVEIGTADLDPGGSTVMTDYTCPSGAPTQYRVRAETTDLDGAPLIGPWSVPAAGTLSPASAEWVLDPASPQTAVHVRLLDADTPAWDSGASAVQVIDRPDAIVVTNLASLDHGSTTAICTTTAQRAALEALLKSGRLLLARLWLQNGHPAEDRWMRVVGAPTRGQLARVDHEARLVTWAWEQQQPPWSAP